MPTIDNLEPSSMELLDAYGENAVWLCKNRKTGYKTRISGVLAQILKKYPKDYKLKLLKMKGAMP
ncbi:MAG TPA: hypothetical protein V6C99_05180 [Oculatellaceae cyanobacterium]|jgi:hypothetical protein